MTGTQKNFRHTTVEGAGSIVFSPVRPAAHLATLAAMAQLPLPMPEQPAPTENPGVWLAGDFWAILGVVVLGVVVLSVVIQL